MKELMILLLFVFISGWTGAPSSQAPLGKFSIGDNCEQCSGGIDLTLITGNGSQRSKLNKIIMDSLISEAPGADHYSVEDFESNRIFENDDCVGISITTLVNINTHSILSLSSKSEGVCGSSVGDYFPAHHVTIDLNTNESLTLAKVIRKTQWENFKRFVSKYARTNKIDNVPYVGGDTKKGKHDQRKINHLPGLRLSFYVNEKVLGVYTLIDDKNSRDWYRKAGEGAVGIEYMNVEIPLSEIEKFIDPNTAISSLVSK